MNSIPNCCYCDAKIPKGRKACCSEHWNLYQKENGHTKEIRKKISTSVKRVLKDLKDKPNGMKGRTGNLCPAHNSNISKVEREKRNKKISKKLRGRKFTEEWKQKLKNAWTEERRKTFSGPNSPFWKGGTSFEPYCPKFNDEFKERVREFFGRCCVNCGREESEQKNKLSVHHVTYNKKMCCDDDEDMGVPHLFIPLCTACHPKTNYNREEWEELFYYIIMFEFNGQCYLSKNREVF